MKQKFYLFFFILGLLSIESNAQLTADFPDSNYSWNESSYTKNCDLDCPFYYVEGTMFDSTTHFLSNLIYRSIYFKGTSFKQIINVVPPVNVDIRNYTILVGYIRNDKLNKKVYFRNNLSDTTRDILLYNFGLKLNEPYPVTLQHPQSSANFNVYRIDTIIDVDGISREIKYIGDSSETNYNLGGILIEGIGNLKTLFSDQVYLMHNWSSYNQVNCFRNNNEEYTFYMGSVSILLDSADNCNRHSYYITSVQSEKIKNLYIFPNPSNKNISIEIFDPNLTFTIKNVIGQTQTIICNYIDGKWHFDISNLTEGMYFLKAVSNNITYTGKFIKQ
jgi:hypothetical protein